MSPDQLSDAGWKEYPAPANAQDRNWQRRVSDTRGTRFFVNVNFWRQSQWGAYDDAYDADAQFHDAEGSPFNVRLLRCTGMTPAEVADWFNRAWEHLGCKHYDLEGPQ